MLSSITNEISGNESLMQRNKPVEGVASASVGGPAYGSTKTLLSSKNEMGQEGQKDGSKGKFGASASASNLTCAEVDAYLDSGAPFKASAAHFKIGREYAKSPAIGLSTFKGRSEPVGGKGCLSAEEEDFSIFKSRKGVREDLRPKLERDNPMVGGCNYTQVQFPAFESKKDPESLDLGKMSILTDPRLTVGDRSSFADGAKDLIELGTKDTDENRTGEKQLLKRGAPLKRGAKPIKTYAALGVKDIAGQLNLNHLIAPLAAAAESIVRPGILKNNSGLKSDDVQKDEAREDGQLLAVGGHTSEESEAEEDYEPYPDYDDIVPAKSEQNKQGEAPVEHKHIQFEESDDGVEDETDGKEQVDKEEDKEDDDYSHLDLRGAHRNPRMRIIDDSKPDCADSVDAKKKAANGSRHHESEVAESSIYESAKEIVSHIEQNKVLRQATKESLAKFVSSGVEAVKSGIEFFSNSGIMLQDGQVPPRPPKPHFGKDRKDSIGSLGGSVFDQDWKGEDSIHRKHRRAPSGSLPQDAELSQSAHGLFSDEKKKKKSFDSASIASRSSFKSSASNKSTKSLSERFIGLFRSKPKKYKGEFFDAKQGQVDSDEEDGDLSALDDHVVIEQYVLAGALDRNDNSKRDKTAGKKCLHKTDPDYLLPRDILYGLFGSTEEKVINKKRMAMIKDLKLSDAIHTTHIFSHNSDGGVVMKFVDPSEIVKYGLNKYQLGIPNGVNLQVGTTGEKMKFDTCFFSAAMVVNSACKLGFERLFTGNAKTIATIFQTGIEPILAQRKESSKIVINGQEILRQKQEQCAMLSAVLGGSEGDGAFVSSLFDEYQDRDVEVPFYNLFIAYCKKLSSKVKERYGNSAAMLKQFPQIAFVESKPVHYNEVGELVQPAIFENKSDFRELKIGDVVFVDINFGSKMSQNPDNTCEVRRHICDMNKNRYSLACAVSKFSPANAAEKSYVHKMKHEHYRATVFKNDYSTLVCDDEHCLKIYHKEDFGRSHANLHGDLKNGAETLFDLHPRRAVDLAIMPVGVLIYVLDKLAK